MDMIALLLPSYWAPALINDDWSGLSDQDESQLRKWLNTNTDLEYCLCCDDEVQISSWHDAVNITGNLITECIKYHFVKKPQ